MATVGWVARDGQRVVVTGSAACEGCPTSTWRSEDGVRWRRSRVEVDGAEIAAVFSGMDRVLGVAATSLRDRTMAGALVASVGGGPEGGSGRDRIDGRGGRDELDGGQGIDTMLGGGGGDMLVGGSSTDILRGGPGDDLLFGSQTHDCGEECSPLLRAGGWAGRWTRPRYLSGRAPLPLQGHPLTSR